MKDSMNTSTPSKVFALDPRYLDAYRALAYDIAFQYVEVPEALDVEVEQVRNAKFRPAPMIMVRFPGRHSKVDHGKLIGGKGAHFHALRRILQEYASHFNHDLGVEIIDPGGQWEKGKPFEKDANWSDEQDEVFR